MPLFAPHGTLKITTEDNIIMIDVEEPWNIDYIDYLHQQLLLAVTQVDYNNFGALFTPKGEVISVEAGVGYHADFIRQGNTKAIAVSLAYCATPLLAESLFSKIYRSAGVRHAFFDNGFDARHWLEKS
jgi:hypothetical protein